MTTASDDPVQIRREIERTQANLSRDVDALTEKVTPGKIVERRVDRARDAATRLRDKVMGSNPVQASSHAAGGVRSAASDAADRVSSTASAATSTALAAASTAVGMVQDSASTAAGAVQDAASTAAGEVQDAASTAAGAVQEAPQALRRQTRAIRWPPGSSRSAPAGWSPRCSRPAAASRSSPTRPSRWPMRRSSRSPSRSSARSRRICANPRSRPSSRSSPHRMPRRR